MGTFYKNNMLWANGKYHFKNEVPVNVRKFINYDFNYGTWDREMGPTVEARSFARKYKNCIKKLLGSGYKIIRWDFNYWTLSATIQSKNEKLIYMSVNDLRYNKDDWWQHILIRTMANEKDWTGGTNHFTNLFDFEWDITHLR